MNNKRISYYIRLQNALRLILPIVIAVLIVVFIRKFNIINLLFPVNVETNDLEDNDYDSSIFVKLEIPEVTYTGFNYCVRGKEKGGYYYYFEENVCHFVILEKEAGSVPFPAKKTNVDVTGKISTNPENLHYIADIMAKQLKWNTADFAKICSPTIINEVQYNPYLSVATSIIILLLLSICAANVLLLIVGIIFPYVSLASMHRGNYITLKKMLKNAEGELRSSVIYHDNGMYITDNYFINISFKSVVLVPLDQIVWAYYHSVLHRNLLFKHTITYTLRLVTDKKLIFSAPNKNKPSCIEVLDLISTMYPEVLIGYTEENHLNFLYHINSFIDNIKCKILKSNMDDDM